MKLCNSILRFPRLLLTHVTVIKAFTQSTTQTGGEWACLGLTLGGALTVPQAAMFSGLALIHSRWNSHEHGEDYLAPNSDQTANKRVPTPKGVLQIFRAHARSNSC